MNLMICRTSLAKKDKLFLSNWISSFFSFTISMMKLRTFFPFSVERGTVFRLMTRFSDSDVKPRYSFSSETVATNYREFDIWSNDAGNVEHTSFPVAIPTWRCCNANRPKSSARSSTMRNTWHAQSFDTLMKLWLCRMCVLYKRRRR